MDRVEEEDLMVGLHTAEAVVAAMLHNTTGTQTLLRRRPPVLVVP
jgi:hypothetical protein